MFKIKLQKNKGFTLIETLVAITILVVAVASPLTLAAQSLFASYYAKDQVIAFNLAQEAVELIRNKRDRNMMVALSTNVDNWLNGILSGESTDVIVDITSVRDNSYTLETCAGGTCSGNERIVFDGNTYVQANNCTANCRKTPFTRYVHIEKVDSAETVNPGKEIKVTAIVTWKTGSFTKREFKISETLYNWTQYLQ